MLRKWSLPVALALLAAPTLTIRIADEDEDAVRHKKDARRDTRKRHKGNGQSGRMAKAQGVIHSFTTTKMKRFSSCIQQDVDLEHQLNQDDSKAALEKLHDAFSKMGYNAGAIEEKTCSEQGFACTSEAVKGERKDELDDFAKKEGIDTERAMEGLEFLVRCEEKEDERAHADEENRKKKRQMAAEADTARQQGDDEKEKAKKADEDRRKKEQDVKNAREEDEARQKKLQEEPDHRIKEAGEKEKEVRELFSSSSRKQTKLLTRRTRGGRQRRSSSRMKQRRRRQKSATTKQSRRLRRPQKTFTKKQRRSPRRPPTRTTKPTMRTTSKMTQKAATIKIKRRLMAAPTKLESRTNRRRRQQLPCKSLTKAWKDIRRGTARAHAGRSREQQACSSLTMSWRQSRSRCGQGIGSILGGMAKALATVKGPAELRWVLAF
eukprot:TRINITY_DN17671_c0_g2_i1.p1 TRINITY_DN17671_c0_g2~~TRINITY_DN17671_c0_g2_i1.p1  ORF type:complete len:435 (-),score=126.08 TRINITY_DN17671_c0_g2_i1:81-1385(-)